MVCFKTYTSFTRLGTLLTILSVSALSRSSESDQSPQMSIPARARLFSLKLNLPYEKTPMPEISEFTGMDDIISTLKNWSKNKDSISFEELSQNWIKDYASTPKMKCTANFYRGYYFACEFLSNLKEVKMTKDQARTQLINLVNGKPNIGKSTFLAVKGNNQNTKNEESGPIGSNSYLIQDEIETLEESNSESLELVPDESSDLLQVMKNITQGK